MPYGRYWSYGLAPRHRYGGYPLWQEAPTGGAPTYESCVKAMRKAQDCPPSVRGFQACKNPEEACQGACECIAQSSLNIPSANRTAYMDSHIATMKQEGCDCEGGKVSAPKPAYTPTDSLKQGATGDDTTDKVGMDTVKADGTTVTTIDDTQKSAAEKNGAPAMVPLTAATVTVPAPLVVVPTDKIVFAGFTREGLLFASSVTVGAVLLGAFVTHALRS